MSCGGRGASGSAAQAADVQVRADLARVNCDSGVVLGCVSQPIGVRLNRLIVATGAPGASIELACNGACNSRETLSVPADGIVTSTVLPRRYLRFGDSIVVRLTTAGGRVCRTLTVVPGGATESADCFPPLPAAAPRAVFAELRGRYAFCGEVASSGCPARGVRVLNLLADTDSGSLVSVRCLKGCVLARRKPAPSGVARFPFAPALTLRNGDSIEVLVTRGDRSWRRIRIGIHPSGRSLRRFDCTIDPLTRAAKGCRLVPQV